MRIPAGPAVRLRKMPASARTSEAGNGVLLPLLYGNRNVIDYVCDADHVGSIISGGAFLNE